MTVAANIIFPQPANFSRMNECITATFAGTYTPPYFFAADNPKTWSSSFIVPADRAKRIMTVRQNVRERKPFQPACFRTLNNADVRDVVRRDCVKSYIQIIAAVRAVRRVRRQYRIRHSALERFRNFLIGENAADFPQAFEFSVAIICAGSFYVNQCSSP